MTLSDLKFHGWISKYSMTRSIARSLCDSWASCFISLYGIRCNLSLEAVKYMSTSCTFLRAAALTQRCTAHTSDERRVWLSVRLSVTRWYWVQTNKRKIMRFSPSGSPGSLVSETKLCTLGRKEHAWWGLQTRLEWVKWRKNADYRPINRCVGKIENKKTNRNRIPAFDWY